MSSGRNLSNTCQLTAKLLFLQATPKIRADALATSHHVIWIGDLNYRLNFAQPGEGVSRRTTFSNRALLIFTPPPESCR